MYSPEVFKSNNNEIAKSSNNEIELKEKSNAVTNLKKALEHFSNTSKSYISIQKIIDKILEEISVIKKKISNNARNQNARNQTARNQTARKQSARNQNARNQTAKYKRVANFLKKQKQERNSQSRHAPSPKKSIVNLQSIELGRLRSEQEQKYTTNMERAIALSTGNKYP